MRYAVLAVGVVIGIIGVVALVGWLLPVGHTAARTANLAASPQAIYDAVHDVTRYPEWRTGITRVDVLESTSGLLRFREHSSESEMIMEIVEATPPALVKDGYGRGTDLTRTIVLDATVGDGVLHVAARAASCDEDGGEGAACHMHQQDWGVPVRIVEGGATQLVLPLSGRS